MLAILVLSYPDPKSFRKQRIYQVITDRFAGGDDCNDKRYYCNGNLKSMAGKLDYIKNLGYTTIWISPTVKQTELPKEQYKGYWPSDFYKTNPKQGSDQDLKNLVTEAHKRDLLVISDINYNNVGQCQDGKVSCITTFPLDAYYHENCNISDSSNSTQLEKCRVNMNPDLNQDHPYVLQELLDWTIWYQKEFNFDGFRICFVQNIGHRFWAALKQISPWFTIGSVQNASYAELKNYTNQELYTTFNEPLFKAVYETIGWQNKSMRQLSEVFEQAALIFGDNVKDLGIYLDNHNTDRFLSSCGKDLMKFQTGVVLQHTWIGIPILFYGTEQKIYGSNSYSNDNTEPLWTSWYGYNESRDYYIMIKKLNAIRDKVKMDKINQQELLVTDDFYSYSRGNQVLVALTNQGYTKQQQIRHKVPNSPFEGNTRICDILTDECINVNEDESVDIFLSNGQARVYIRESLM
ncbi:Alpha_amylase [Hexamita inflata]|uniref:alpha-amylase n=1 Tax=Hexamita inflata TaxID=28002 RepID=A0AA86PEW0_9EUKA|nr:Alpha amylase [Hexamita inflata]CAI9936831.1 Alpha amylase [Hexamita inflata]